MLLNQSRFFRFLLSFVSALMMLFLLLTLPQGVKAKVEAQGDMNRQIKGSVLFTVTVPITSTESPNEEDGAAIFKPVEPTAPAEAGSEETPETSETPEAPEAPEPTIEAPEPTIEAPEAPEPTIEAPEPTIEASPIEGESEGEARFIPIEPPTEPITPTEPISEPITPTEPISEPITPTEPISEVITPTEPISEVITPTEAISEVITPTEAISEVITPTEVISEVIAPTEVISEVLTPTEAIAPIEQLEQNEEQLLTATLPISDSVAVEEEAPPIVISASLGVPANIACLPFALPTITEYNGKRQNGPYLRGTTQTVITWQDVAETETSYRVERQVGDEAWEEIASLAPNSTLHTDKGLDANQRYRYRVRATEGETVGAYSNVCGKPLFLETPEGHFRLFYRPEACPAISDDATQANKRGTCFGNVAMVRQLGANLESARLAIIELGFKDPVRSAPMPVDLFPCDGVGCAVVGGGRAILLTPYFMKPSSQASLWTPMHELFHHTQGRYGGLYDPNYEWLTEGQARVIQDQLLGGRSNNYREEVNSFLANPNQPLTEASYQAALFWTYLMEQYSGQEQADQKVDQKADQEAYQEAYQEAPQEAAQERDSSFDFLLKFWENSQANRRQNGITVINQTLYQMGYEERFRDVFKNFAVANYTKAMPNVPAQYQYINLQAATSYRSVPLALNRGLTAKQEISSQSDVVSWGSRYFRIKPESSVQAITFSGVAEHELYYTLLAFKNGEVVKEVNDIATVFTRTLSNNNLDEMVLVVVGLEQESSFDFSFRATQSSRLLNEIRRILIALPRSYEPERSSDNEVERKVQ